MSVKPDFTTMTTLELRAYILAHRDDEEALQTYLDKRHKLFIIQTGYSGG